MVRFADCACLPVRGVVWCRSDPNSVQNRLKRVRSVQFACLMPDRVGCQFVRFSSWTGAKCLRSVHPLGQGRPCHPANPIGFASEGHGSPPPVNYIPTKFKDDICTNYIQKCTQILLCKGKLYHRFKQNVPESESRQFDRLRLRLLARCHDSGRHRFRL